MTSWIKRFPVTAFTVLVFGALWLSFLALRTSVSPLVAVLVGSWLPTVVAVLVTAAAGGRAGLGELLGQIVRWRFGFRWYAIALLGPVAVTLLSVAAYSVTGNPAPRFAPPEAILPIVLGSLLTGATGEELGWRGLALPGLQARWNALTSSLVLGVVWGLYHYPAWLMPGTPQAGASFVAFMLGVIPFSVFISWVFNHAGGSLIVAVLAHFAFNLIGNLAGVFAVRGAFWFAVVLWWMVAIAIVAYDWQRFTVKNALHSTVEFR